MELIKHLHIFDPSSHKEEIAVIGAGATGSAVALQLAKLGLTRVNVYDFDYIEDHNIPNQMLYKPSDAGKFKAEILCKAINNLVGNGRICKPHVTQCGSIKLNERTVFFCVDSMAARKKIFESCIFLNGRTNLLVDPRMDAYSGSINIIDPTNIRHCDYYKTTLYSDSDVNSSRGNCGVTLSVGATASLVANYAVWMFINWVTKKDQSVFELRFNINPLMLVSTKFDSMEQYMDELEE